MSALAGPVQATMEVPISSLISSKADYRGGRPFITGTGVSVGRVGTHYSKWGSTAEEIAEDFNLTLPQVFAALAHYLANQSAIDADLQAQDVETDRIAAEWAATGRRQ